MDPFVHLHVHTDNSLLDGHSTIPELAAQAASFGQPALSINDHGNLFGARKHWESCNANGIKPIIGCEFYVAPVSRFTKEPVYWGKPEQRSDDISGQGSYTHLTVMATSVEGVRNLFRLHATSYADGFYRKPRIDLDSLATHNSGLLVATGCAGGELSTRIRLGQLDEAKRYLSSLRDIFPDRVWVEVMSHDNPIDDRINPALLELARLSKTPVVATNDSHYTKVEDATPHDALLCLQTGQRLNGDNRKFQFEGHGYHLRTHREMAEVFRDLPNALSSTLDIAERVEDVGAIFTGNPRLPRYSQPDFPTNEEYLRDIVFSFIASREWANREEAEIRASYELDVILGLGFTDYILFLRDMTEFAKSRNIRIGPGRGSGAGSLVVYCAGITDLNPLSHQLLFERFINPERVSYPDIDVDIQKDRRDEVIEWAVEKYGHENFAQIGTSGVIGAKSALHDSARVLGKPRYLSDNLVKRLPPAKFGRQPSLREGDWGGLTDGEREVLSLAESLEGRIRNVGIHAAGVVISEEPLRELVPLYKRDGHPSWVTAYDMNDVEAVGLVKYDWLGLKALEVVDKAMAHIDKLNLPWKIPILSTELKDLTDDSTYELLQRGDTLGVFQLDGAGMQQLLRSVRPDRFGDISAILALYRPGPMAANAHRGYADRKNGKERISYPHRELEAPLKSVLGETYGFVVYQEQVLEILRICCGYTYASAEKIFNAMRKKDTQKMLEAKPDFSKRMSENGYSEECSEALWEVLVPFSDYSFNRSHTTGYGVNSYWTAYLKANFFKEYWAAALTCQTDPEKLPTYIAEVEKFKHVILPPGINDSDVSWTPSEDGIKYGLKSIKGFGDKSFDKLLRDRPFRSLHDFFKRADRTLLSKKNLPILIKSGALDDLSPHREDLLLHHETLAERALNDRALAKKGEMPLLAGKYEIAGRTRPDHGLRRQWELELLGLELSAPAIVLETTRWLEENEFLYLKEVVDQYPGRQHVSLKIGYATVDVGYVKWSEKVEKQVLSVGGVRVEAV